ncbi:MAG: hypothetical protein WHU54_06950 [Candidatus Bathyarchaeia archaeon]|jgi:hypothetical protein
MASNDKNAIIKNILAGILMATGLFSATVFLSNSWIKLAIVGLLVTNGILWLIFQGILRKTIKYVVLGIMIFTVSFSIFEKYTFWNAGSPPAFAPFQPGVTVSYANILNVSLTEIVQSVKNSPAFGLIGLEYPGIITFESMKLDTTFGGGSIEVLFYQKASNMGFRFVSSSGQPYRLSIFFWNGQPFSSMFPQKQTPEETLERIDSLGLRWFYNRAAEAYQNTTGKIPQVNALQISIQWENYGNYQGITLLLIGLYHSTFVNQSVFFADFQPDGTLLYLNVAP